MPMTSIDSRRFSADAGIAIGPILFIIAILAILAAAIAAGSGSFTTGTTTESNRTKSSALMQIGDNLKVGMDRVVLEGGVAPGSVDTNVQNTSLNNQLFSPIGGGISPPSVGMANNPAVDKWYFANGPVQGLGTGANNIVAFLPVSQGVCAEINNRAVAANTAPASAALGNVVAGTLTGGSAWPTTPPLVGVATGCVQDSSVTVASAGPSSQYMYYEVLAVQ